MCGITGIYNYTTNEPVNKGIFEKVTNSIIHRGPDEFGYFYDDKNGVGLSSRRLSIIDLTTGKQPLYNEDGSIVLVGNGEIYNFPELYEHLVSKGHRFKTKSDIIITHQWFRGASPFHCQRRIQIELDLSTMHLRQQKLREGESSGDLSQPAETPKKTPSRRTAALLSSRWKPGTWLR